MKYNPLKIVQMITKPLALIMTLTNRAQVIKFIDDKKTENNIYFIMEFCKGVINTKQ